MTDYQAWFLLSGVWFIVFQNDSGSLSSRLVLFFMGMGFFGAGMATLALDIGR